MRSAWLAENAVRKLVLADHMDFDLLPMVFAQAYYAIRDMASVYLWITRGNRPETHEYILRELAQDVFRGIMPSPWDNWVQMEVARSRSGGPKFTVKDAGGSLAIMGEEDAPSSLAQFKATHSEQHLKRCLRTTGQKSHRFKRARSSQKEIITAFDFIYRLRVNANYSDMDMFLEMQRDRDYDLQFGVSVLEMVSDILDVFTTLIVKTAGREIVDRQVEATRLLAGPTNSLPSVVRFSAF